VLQKKEAAHMNDYMRALHQRFFQEPDCTEIRRELETLRLTLRDKLDRQDRETLLKLTDLAIELREVVSLASFTAGFQLALGIAGELTPYSFEDDEEERALRRQEQKEP
jgi:hypothetical protein